MDCLSINRYLSSPFMGAWEVRPTVPTNNLLPICFQCMNSASCSVNTRVALFFAVWTAALEIHAIHERERRVSSLSEMVQCGKPHEQDFAVNHKDLTTHPCWIWPQVHLLGLCHALMNGSQPDVSKKLTVEIGVPSSVWHLDSSHFWHTTKHSS